MRRKNSLQLVNKTIEYLNNYLNRKIQVESENNLFTIDGKLELLKVGEFEKETIRDYRYCIYTSDLRSLF